MLHKDFIYNVKILTIALIVVITTGCGGGNTATTSNGSNTPINNDSPVNDDRPSPQPDPAPTYGTAELSWLAPTKYVDDTLITKLAGFYIYINDGTGFKKYATISNPSVTTYIAEKLTAGSYTFTVTAFDLDGIESSYSNTAEITI